MLITGMTSLSEKQSRNSDVQRAPRERKGNGEGRRDMGSEQTQGQTDTACTAPLASEHMPRRSNGCTCAVHISQPLRAHVRLEALHGTHERWVTV